MTATADLIKELRAMAAQCIDAPKGKSFFTEAADRLQETDPHERAKKAVLTTINHPFHPFEGSKLLSSVEMLTKPKWADMTDEERLLYACLITYVKHHMGIDVIGWNELGDRLHDALCQACGDDAIVRWGNMIRDAEDMPP